MLSEHQKELSRNVFEYMDPSFRFHLSLHLPALRSVEKEARLNINQLVFEDNQLFIENKTKYELKIDRKYAIEDRPFRINKIHDENEFGFPANTNCIMMNGDVCMENENSRSTRAYERLMETVKEKEPPECKSTLKLTYITGYGEIRIYTSSTITTIYEGIKVLIQSIKISMGQSSILSVSYGNSILHDAGSRREIWIVKMEVLRR
ncbi:Protein CBG11843 [Caenorhabditis briggsae]|uniref:Protein CBG11843 n=1 Tax=Caenorhabditis briggsae TaxID=6238 RepID=A8XE53_CAEBR|nr:Protein CBG11843 [Caenorhabditis briggsae]CAP30925.2 Protein CBG11843 [Caenorhabditis briggsae]